MKKLSLILCLALVVVLLATAVAAAGGEGKKEKKAKVTVCHRTGAKPVENGGFNEENAGSNGSDRVLGHVITISESALPAHLAHGDREMALGTGIIYGKGKVPCDPEGEGPM